MFCLCMVSKSHMASILTWIALLDTGLITWLVSWIISRPMLDILMAWSSLASGTPDTTMYASPIVSTYRVYDIQEPTRTWILNACFDHLDKSGQERFPVCGGLFITRTFRFVDDHILIFIESKFVIKNTNKVKTINTTKS